MDLKHNEHQGLTIDDFMIGDLRNPNIVKEVIDQPFDEVYQLAADMGRAGYIFTCNHDADVMHNSATINLNTLHFGKKAGKKNLLLIFCLYLSGIQPDGPR